MKRRVTLLAVCVLSAACLTPQHVDAQQYFPLELGNAWVYGISLQGKPSNRLLQVLVSAITNEPGGRVFVVSELDESLEPADRPDQPVTYQVRGGGVFCQEESAFLLPDPLSKGLTWPAGRTAADGQNRIVSVDFSVEVGRQVFKDCLVVERSDPARDRRIEMVFAPDVGLVRSRFFRLSGSGAAEPYREESLVERGRITPPRFLRPPK